METKKTRIESDLIGSREIPEEALYGVQTLRGIENFPISQFKVCQYPLFIKGLAVTKKAYRILAERNYPSKLLIASSRVSPVVNGRQEIWHLEKLAGGNIVITMNPNLIKAFMLHYIDRPIENKIDEPIPEDVMAKLLRIPYFAEGYGENTIKPEDFETLEPTQTTYAQFSKAMIELEDYIENLFREVKEKVS